MITPYFNDNTELVNLDLCSSDKTPLGSAVVVLGKITFKLVSKAEAIGGCVSLFQAESVARDFGWPERLGYNDGSPTAGASLRNNQ